MVLKKIYLSIALLALITSKLAAQSDTKTVVVIFDGLRPDFVTKELMPNLYALKKQAGYAADNHSVFPTVTRVNSSSFATASYPRTHGILGNSVHIPALGNDMVYNTGDMSDLRIIDSLSGGKLLTTVSAAEVLARHGKRMYVFSSGSTGQAFLQNHRVKGAIIHPEFILPASLAPAVTAAVGEPGATGNNKFAKHIWVTDAFLHFGLAPDGPEVSSVWYSEPDATQHMTGIGSPQSLEVIRVMDDQLGRISDALRARGLTGKVNLIVTADHGFISYKGDHTIGDFLVREGFRKDRESDDIIIADGAIFVKNKQPGVIEAIVEKLQQQPWAGPIFTAPKAVNSPEGTVSGTLSFDIVHWNHPDRTADILVTYDWNDTTNEYGYKGVQTSKSRIAAGHGGISFHEIRTPMVLSGPAFKPAHISELPSSFIDIMPTVLAIHGIERPAEMDGRVLREFFTTTAKATLPEVKRETISNKIISSWGSYEVKVRLSTVDAFRYLDYGQVARKKNN